LGRSRFYAGCGERVFWGTRRQQTVTKTTNTANTMTSTITYKGTTSGLVKNNGNLSFKSGYKAGGAFVGKKQ
jgi:hypothetical protein